ncbi:MAG: energy-coupling factor transporter transmembrane component T [Peptostreptococcaceae bacterium]|nr:energy-coupling factor transporter transmembrane component T [Peptostreptococcaceae bacterium]MDY5739268.1 energy-coupling factor transporter transmembrane component T [Anaerovoracaceae bacterium]SFE45322.1 energy-coupling factor transport system permease protein [Peptostreptococcaceae bacterium pGA-8]
MRRDAFSGYNPYVNFIFYIGVLGFSMILKHPIVLLTGFICAAAYGGYLRRRRILRTLFCFIFPMMLIGSLLNPLFNHRGQTILFYLRGNPMTLEAMLFGVAAAFMVGTVILWFYTFNDVMTSDKLMHVFGRIIPGLNLLFSMVLRFIPRFNKQIGVISNAQKCIGRDVSNGSRMDRARHGMKIISVMTTWGLENAVDLGDSMKSRGFGLRGRTSFFKYRFDSRDSRLTLFMVTMAIIITYGIVTGDANLEYYPKFIFPPFTLRSIVTFIAYFLFSSIPLAVDFQEDLKWKRLKSRI